MNNFEITKREILFSIIIAAVMILFGLLIHGKISDGLMEDYQKYETALKIQNDSDLFEYGMKTNVGNAFVYGDLQAVDTVSYSDVSGEYMYIRKTEEHYCKHTRQVPHTRVVNGKSQTYYTTETYWTWDYVGKEDKHSDKISFLGIEFDYGKIDTPSSRHIDTVNGGYHIRFVYDGVDAKYTGTLFTNLNNKTIADNSNFYINKTIDETMESLESGGELIAFWIVWILLTGGVVFAFYYFDNRWLEDKNKKRYWN